MDKFVSSQSFILKPGDVMPFQLLDVSDSRELDSNNITAFGRVAP